MMRLVEAPLNVELLVSEIKTGKEGRRKLNTLGIQTEEKLIKIYDANWGPVLVQTKSNGRSKIAIGRGLAERIEVDYEE
jgi:Fe2+ transport system protein FeoA